MGARALAMRASKIVERVGARRTRRRARRAQARGTRRGMCAAESSRASPPIPGAAGARAPSSYRGRRGGWGLRASSRGCESPSGSWKGAERARRSSSTKAPERCGPDADPEDARGRVGDDAVRRDERVDGAAVAEGTANRPCAGVVAEDGEARSQESAASGRDARRGARRARAPGDASTSSRGRAGSSGRSRSGPSKWFVTRGRSRARRARTPGRRAPARRRRTLPAPSATNTMCETMTRCARRMPPPRPCRAARSSTSRSENATGIPSRARLPRARPVHDDGDALRVHPRHDPDEPGPGHARERDRAVLAHEEDGLVAIEDVPGLEVERAPDEHVPVRGLRASRAKLVQPMSGECSSGSAMS